MTTRRWQRIGKDAAAGSPDDGVSLGLVSRRGGFAMVLLFGAALVCIAGCSGKNKNLAPTRLGPRAIPYLTGIPVPSGFKLKERPSEAYESGGVRFARQEYTGYADRTAVGNFYKEQMPVMGWNLVSSQEVKGRITSRFEDKSEECTVTIEGGGFLMPVSIQVIVKPFNRNFSEPPPRRPMP